MNSGKPNMGRQSTRKQRQQEERQIAKQQRKLATPPVEFKSLPTFREEPEAKITNRVFYTEAMLEKIGEADLSGNDLKALLYIRLKCVKDRDWSKKQGYCYTEKDNHEEMKDIMQMSYDGAYKAISRLEKAGFIETSKPARGSRETTVKYIFENITQDT